MNGALMCDQDQRDRLNLKATELRLGLPGSDECDEQETVSTLAKNNKRASPESAKDSRPDSPAKSEWPPAPKASIIGWPPVRSQRKGKHSETDHQSGVYVKVSMDGAPYLRKVDLKIYNGYSQLLKALETMFKFSIGEYSEREGYNGSEYAPAYEDKDGDLMLLGDVPWEMFKSCCRRVRIMRGVEGKGLGFGALTKP